MLLLISDYLARVPNFFLKFNKKMTNPNIYRNAKKKLDILTH